MWKTKTFKKHDFDFLFWHKKHYFFAWPFSKNTHFPSSRFRGPRTIHSRTLARQARLGPQLYSDPFPNKAGRHKGSSCAFGMYSPCSQRLVTSSVRKTAMHHRFLTLIECISLGHHRLFGPHNVSSATSSVFLSFFLETI